jgi:hypothetical protein
MVEPPPEVKKLARTREVEGERWVHRFANGLVVHTDPFMRADPARVLPLGGPQDAIVSRLASLPELVAGKRVFEPFAGSGIFGLMALRLGAAQVDFLDVNPRARQFQIENAGRNGFAEARYRALLGSIADFAAEQPYDLVLANPPFVPTPDGIAGTLTSNGGPEGNDLLEHLLLRLPRMLTPAGELYACLMQLVAVGRPVVATAIERHLDGRHVELTEMQTEPTPIASYVEAYGKSFPSKASEIARWALALGRAYGPELGVQHYVMHVMPSRPGPATYRVAANLLAKYGQLPYPAWSFKDLALARVMENVVPEVS